MDVPEEGGVPGVAVVGVRVMPKHSLDVFVQPNVSACILKLAHYFPQAVEQHRNSCNPECSAVV